MLVARTYLKLWRGSSLQPVELVVDTRSTVSGVGSLSRGYQRVEGITSASSKRGWQLSAGHRVNVPVMPVATWGAFSFELSLLGWAGPAEKP